MSTKNLIMGLWWSNPPFEGLENFLASLHATSFEGDVCVFTDQVGVETVQRLVSHGVIVEPASPFHINRMSPPVSRYFNYLDFLARHAQEYRYVMISDLRDVIFQSDPFASPLPADVVFAQERCLLRDCPTTGGWVREAYGDAIAHNLRQWTISCSGTTFGTVSGMLEYLALMAHEITSRDIPLFGGLDQGIHNYVLRMRPPLNAWFDWTDSLAATLHYMPETALSIGPKGILVDGRAVPVIHQWDRRSMVAEYVRSDKRFSLSTPSPAATVRTHRGLPAVSTLPRAGELPTSAAPAPTVDPGELSAFFRPPGLDGVAALSRINALVRDVSLRSDDEPAVSDPTGPDEHAAPASPRPAAHDTIMCYYERNRDVGWLAPFLASARGSGFRGDIVCVGAFDQSELPPIERYGARIFAPHNIYPALDAENGAHLFMRLSLDEISHIPELRPSHVLLIDTVRATFCRDPFLTQTIGLSVFAEGPASICDSSSNMEWLSFFESEVGPYTDKPIVSSSAVRGPLDVVQLFTRQLLSEYAGKAELLAVPKSIQGAFNKICYGAHPGYPITIHPNGSIAYFEIWPSDLPIETHPSLRVAGNLPSIIVSPLERSALTDAARSNLGL